MRLVEAEFRNRDEAAAAAGVAKSTFQRWVEGKSDPSFLGLSNLARVSGFSLDWLATGRGAMRAGEAAPAGHQVALDRELHGRVVDGIAKIYKEERIGLPGVDLGRLAADMYADLANAGLGSWEEKMAALRFALEQLRRTLRVAPVADEASSKRSA